MKTLTQSKLKKFQNIFNEKKAILLSNKPPADFDLDGGDEVDLVQNKVMIEMAERLSFREKQTLININNALQRIHDGTFGICEECEEPIGEKRLMAVPDCVSCIFCAEQLEKQAKQYQKS